MFRINSNRGTFSLGKFSFTWENSDDAHDWPGFTTIGWGDTFLELGDIDEGNGIFLTRYAHGDIDFTKTLLRF